MAVVMDNLTGGKLNLTMEEVRLIRQFKCLSLSSQHLIERVIHQLAFEEHVLL